jgi:hypothetical protein
VWKRAVDGRVLTFRLIGINNQNFLMEDAETGSWWQQVSGQAVRGPLRGKRLTQVLHDESTFGLWLREHPDGRVLALSDEQAQIREDWEVRTAKLTVVVPVPGDSGNSGSSGNAENAGNTAKAGDSGDPADSGEPGKAGGAGDSGGTRALEPRALVVGLVIDGRAKAYPHAVLAQARAVMDRVGTTPVVVLLGADGASARAFDRRLDGQELELMARPGSSPARFVDTRTGSEWDITGRAVSGPLAGRTLTRLPSLSDYWFDWHLYHPDTDVLRQWTPPASR